MEYDEFGDEMLNYIDNIEFSNGSKDEIIYSNRNIIKDSIHTFFNRFKNEKDFSKNKIKLFNKKVEKLYNILLTITLRYIKYIPNTFKNYKKYIIYDNMNKITFYNLISNTITNSKSIHDNMNELFLVNKTSNKNNRTLVLNEKYIKTFLEMFNDILKLSDFKIDNINVDNFNININSMLKLISAYSIKNDLYDKVLYPYNINGNYVYRNIKVLHLYKVPNFINIYDRIIELLIENNENIIKTFIIMFNENNKLKIFIPKNYFNKNKILFHCIETEDDNIISNEAKLDIIKLKDKDLHDKIYIKVFGFNTILRFLTIKDENKFENNERLCKIIEKVQDKLKMK